MRAGLAEAEGIVLRMVRVREADRVVTLLTREAGVVSAVARGAERSRKRFGAALAPYVVGRATFAPRARGDLEILERFEPLRDHTRLALDVVGHAHAAYVTELAGALLVPNQPEPAVLDLLCDAYALLEAGPLAPAALRALELTLLDLVGVRPVLDACASCGRTDGLDPALLDPSRGGALCVACAPRGHGKPITADTRRALAALQDVAIADAHAAPPAPPELVRPVREAAHALAHAHVRHPLRSLEFLTKLREATP